MQYTTCTVCIMQTTKKPCNARLQAAWAYLLFVSLHQSICLCQASGHKAFLCGMGGSNQQLSGPPQRLSNVPLSVRAMARSRLLHANTNKA
eukprot:scaffold48954_cov32-Tisochrysis_lutea.AAC.1